jgi:hypothetical protein
MDKNKCPKTNREGRLSPNSEIVTDRFFKVSRRDFPKCFIMIKNKKTRINPGILNLKTF